MTQDMSLLERARQGVPLTGLGVVDMHAHVGPYLFAIPHPTSQGMLDVMDRTGVAVTVTAPMPRMSHEDAVMGNRLVLDAMQAHPGRFLGYMYLWPAGSGEVRLEAEACAEAGFAGVKLHNMNGMPYTHPGYEPALAIANERRMPVLLHTWGAKEEFEQVRALVQRYPEISVLLAHAGATNEPDYCRLARDCANVYLELARSLSRPGVVEHFVEEVGAHKVVWGSDICFISQAHQLGKVLCAKLPDDVKRQVLSSNARRILGRVEGLELPRL